MRDKILLMGWVTFCASGALVAAAARPVSEPRFSDYPAAIETPPQAGIVLRLTTPQTRRYATVLRDNFKKPANFAGHLRVAIWGCGTDCRNFAILDKRTGAAYTLPHVSEIAGVMGNDDERIDFRPDSRLLVIAGQINETGTPGKFYYLWTGQALKRIHVRPLNVEPIDTTAPDSESQPADGAMSPALPASSPGS